MIQIPENPFVLIDGSSYFYRAYHAFPPLTNSKGEPTGAMYGVINMLRSLILKYHPIYAVVIFDKKDKTFRNELFKHYKSHRPSMPEDLQTQIKPLYSIIKAMGLPIIAISGIEADDIIGTLAKEAEKIGRSVLISTNDKDMTQLVTKKTTLINTMYNSIFGPKEVIDKYGVPPESIPDLLSLMGDYSDNIPGIPGIGKRIATILIKTFGNLDNLYAKSEKISNLTFRGAKKIAEKIEKNKEIAYLSYQLAKIRTDIRLDSTFQQLKIQQPVHEKLLELFHKYEFKQFIKDIENRKWLKIKNTSLKDKQKKIIKYTDNTEDKVQEEIYLPSFEGYEIILNERKLNEWIKKLKKASIFSFNIKTNNINDISASIVGISFAITPGKAAYIPIAHNYIGAPKQLPICKVLKLLQFIFENEKILKIGQNLKYDCRILQNYGIELRGIAFDTMIESYMLNSTLSLHDKNSLSERRLKHKIISFEKKVGISKNQLALNQITLEKSGCYAAGDADVILQLHCKMWQELQKYEGPLNIFQNFEMPLVPVLSRIERNGVKIDSLLLQKYSKEISIQLAELEKVAYKITGEIFNLSSTKQLQTILFEKQGIKPIKKTSRGALSTAEEILEELSLDNPLPKVVLQYRRLIKLKSNYTDKLPLMINQKTGRIHTSYHQTVTATGRLSSTNPNLQNIPIRSQEGRRIRQAFIAPEDHIIISADYSQIELRVMAHFSRDKSLLEAFSKGKDIHITTASEIFGIPLGNISQEQRQIAKTINFGLIYGMSAFGLSRRLNIPHKESQKYIDLYFRHYSGISDYMKYIRIYAREKGYVETVSGRRLYLPDINSNNSRRRAIAERAAINASIQGTAADIIKKAMIIIDTWLKEKQPYVRMIMQIHDELVFEVHKENAEVVSKKIHKLMENSIKLDIPLLVKVGMGENWDQAH